MMWSMLKFQPINLFNAPIQVKICKHKYMAIYVSWGKKVCIDCGVEQPLYDMKIQHQR